MALLDLYTNLLIWARWLHVILGMLWVGQLYFFEFVAMPLQRRRKEAIDGERAPMLLRALALFQWSGLAAVGSGLLLLTMTYFYAPDRGFAPTANLVFERAITSRAIWIFIGMALAIWMAFNVWFVFAPAQRKLLRGKADLRETPGLQRRALLSLRTSTFLSGPMIFTMIAPSHYGAVNLNTLAFVAVVCSALVWFAVAAARL